MSGIQEMVQIDPSGVLVFTVIGISRAVQGACNGILFVIFQVSFVVKRYYDGLNGKNYKWEPRKLLCKMFKLNRNRHAEERNQIQSLGN